MEVTQVTFDAPGLKVVGYGRVSTEEQVSSGAGLSAQELLVRDECKRRGWELVEFVRDAGVSGKNLKRPGIVKVLDMLGKREAAVLVVAKLDRLSRSMLDFATVMAKAENEQWAVVALDCAVDTTTPAGEAMANVLGAFAQFERRLVGQRTREALAVKRSEGVRLGRPPQVPQLIAERVHHERRAGATLRAIASGLTADGVPTSRGGAWMPSTIARILKRPVEAKA